MGGGRIGDSEYDVGITIPKVYFIVVKSEMIVVLLIATSKS